MSLTTCPRRHRAPLVRVLIACTLGAAGCDLLGSRGSTPEAAEPTPTAATTVEATVQPAPAPAATTANAPAAPTKSSAPRERGEAGLLEALADVSVTRELATASDSVVDGLETAVDIASDEVAERRKTTAVDPTPATPAVPAVPKTPRAKPATPGKAEPKSCSAETYNWNSIRIDTEFSGTVKLKNGSWGHYDITDYCHDLSIDARTFADLNGDGRTEAYLLITETVAASDGEFCIFGMADSSEAVYAFELDATCKPRLAEVIWVRQCEHGPCEDPLKLSVSGRELRYGRKRLAWINGELEEVGGAGRRK